jgi:hypothetical protein
MDDDEGTALPAGHVGVDRLQPEHQFRPARQRPAGIACFWIGERGAEAGVGLDDHLEGGLADEVAGGFVGEYST